MQINQQLLPTVVNLALYSCSGSSYWAYRSVLAKRCGRSGVKRRRAIGNKFNMKKYILIIFSDLSANVNDFFM